MNTYSNHMLHLYRYRLTKSEPLVSFGVGVRDGGVAQPCDDERRPTLMAG